MTDQLIQHFDMMHQWGTALDMSQLNDLTSMDMMPLLNHANTLQPGAWQPGALGHE